MKRTTTVAEVAAHFNYRIHAVRYYIRQGAIPAVKRGNSYVIDADFIDAHTVFVASRVCLRHLANEIGYTWDTVRLYEATGRWTFATLLPRQFGLRRATISREEAEHFKAWLSAGNRGVYLGMPQ